jgi:hypothetical protein
MRTRHAEDDAPFRQERFMSSVELDRGLIANCVASRLRVVDDAEQRKLIWWLQKQSHAAGGLDRLALEIIEGSPEHFITRAMQALGCGRGRSYDAAEVREVRGEMPGLRDKFLLRGEDNSAEFWYDDRERNEAARREEKRLSKVRPESYPAAQFGEYCVHAAKQHLGKFLFQQICLDPSIDFEQGVPWYAAKLLDALCEAHERAAERASAQCEVTTSVGALVNESLDYVLALGGLVIVDGLARIGKTFAARTWCDAHPGEARYVQVPSSNDDISFYRAIAKSLGIGTSHAYKALELRERIEDVLQPGDLAVVFDEGHYLFPQRNMRKAVPHRINWILTQLVNMGVPVAIVTTPQFTKSQELLVRNGGWSSEQLIGRIKHYQQLPDSLPADELRAVAQTFLPDGDADSIDLLVSYAQGSEKYLAGIESLAARARYLAGKAGRAEPTFLDVSCAFQGSVVPSDNAIAATLAASRPAPKKTRLAASVQTPRAADAQPVHPPFRPARLPAVPAAKPRLTTPDSRMFHTASDSPEMPTG